MTGLRSEARTVWASVALVVLLASTWLIVGVALHTASTPIVAAGRTGFTVLGLFALTWWSSARRSESTVREEDNGPRGSLNRPYRWWQVIVLALTG